MFAHNDLLLGNVIFNKDEGTISFIDYEYASYNYQAFDIANHFNEFVGEYIFIIFEEQTSVLCLTARCLGSHYKVVLEWVVAFTLLCLWTPVTT